MSGAEGGMAVRRSQRRQHRAQSYDVSAGSPSHRPAPAARQVFPPATPHDGMQRSPTSTVFGGEHTGAASGGVTGASTGGAGTSVGVAASPGTNASLNALESPRASAAPSPAVAPSGRTEVPHAPTRHAIAKKVGLECACARRSERFTVRIARARRPPTSRDSAGTRARVRDAGD